MQPTSLSLTARTLYAELRELALAAGATENIGNTPGSVVKKTVRGSAYLYFQYRDLDGHLRQAYLGPENTETQAVVQRLQSPPASRTADLQHMDKLRAAFIAAGGGAMEHGPLRVLKAFADAGLLIPGAGHAVLVGTHAFNALGNLLGVRWGSQMMTQDIDLAGQADIDIAVSHPQQSAPDILQQLDMGFIPVPALDPRSPSTSYKVRGKELRVDLLTPLVGKQRAASIFVPALKAPAQALRFLDYLIEQPVPAVMIGRSTLFLANVQRPERFALHKLIVSESREAVFAAKAEKDRLQAMQLLQVLVEEAPDSLPQAKHDLLERGKGWSDKLHKALKKSRRHAPDAAAYLEAL